jgi:predicted  nucleic acid-binding Zn-ribbon protein|tara:strand:- start:851 stop:1102 length:252 start_codon:yes stop_codon:yes gene_type:complete
MAKKLTKDEIKNLEDIRNTFSGISRMIGDNEISIANLQSKKEDLIESLRKLNEKQKIIVEGLEGKYGKGSINLEIGEFTPIQD